MSVIRAFIAIDLSPEIQLKITEVLEGYKELLVNVPIRWVAVANIHLTLKFLGDVSLVNLPILKDMLQSEVSSQREFEISVGKSGAFPNNRQPRVIWVGVEAPPGLYTIQSGIENSTARLGYTREERPFSPHLTLGRISRNATPMDVKKISHSMGTNRVGFLGATRVEKINLYRSDLKPSGAVYTRIYSIPLAGISQI